MLSIVLKLKFQSENGVELNYLSLIWITYVEDNEIHIEKNIFQ